MVRLVDILNKDIGSIATKVFKADVGDMVKGASRALNTDVSTIAKGAGKVLRYDLSELFVNNESSNTKDNLGDVNTSELGTSNSGNAGTVIVTGTPEISQTTHTNTGSVVNNTAVDSPESAGKNKAGVAVAGQPTAGFINTAASAAPKAKLTEALVNRQQHITPKGSALSELMPLKIGDFTRAASAAHGDIANDPVSITYSSDIEALSLTLDACWDSDEALVKLNRRRTALENARNDASNTWVAGINGQGVVFMWRRGQYCFEIVSPRGVSPAARFLADFPY